MVAAPLAIPAVLIGAVFAVPGGLYLLRYMRKLSTETKADFVTRVDKLEKTYHDALDDLTGTERTRLSQHGMQVLTPIFSRLEALAAQAKEALASFEQYGTRAATLKRTIEAETSGS
jgi:predicted ribosome quality control (RQC) complex YloA/Tae2 family protein